MNCKPHKYKKFRIGKNKDYIIYKCMNPGCEHYKSLDLIPGSQSECWACGKVMIITPARLMTKPTCCTAKKFLALDKVEAKPADKSEMDDLLNMLKD